MPNALKAVGKTDTEFIVENHIVVFGGRDLEGHVNDNFNADGSRGEYFTKSTDLRSPYTNTGVLYVDWEHGYGDDGEPGKDDILGFVDWSTAKADDEGVLVRRILDRRNRYVQMLEPLIEAGIIGTSSEAVPHGVRKANSGAIERWPLRRDTLTVTPMEPRMVLGDNALRAVKALVDVWPELREQADKAALFDVSEDSRSGVMVALFPPPAIANMIAAMDGVTEMADDLHVTLAYYGSVDEMESIDVADVIKRVKVASHDFGPISGRLGGIGRFSASDTSDGMDVLYLNVDCPGLDRLRDDIAMYSPTVLRNHGYTPHMTLAYLNPDADMPITKWEPMPVVFDAITITVGDKREDFQLVGERMRAVEGKAVTTAGSAGDALPAADNPAADIEQHKASDGADTPGAERTEGASAAPSAAADRDIEAERLTLELELLQLEVTP